MNTKVSNAVGIDDMALYVPSLYLPIKSLAEARSIEYPKLNKGLGLQEMSVTDVHEDSATMAANAVLELIERNQLHPASIGRIYLGTESALDGAKPTATYTLEMLQQYLEPVYGPDCLLHCDVIDMTFACIGAVDAMLNSLDWIRCGEDRQAIVVATDDARYDLASTGEYTQGAGAVAMLLKQQPRLLTIGDAVGTATRPVHDFFKPRRSVRKRDLLQEALSLAGQPDVDVDALLASLDDQLEQHGVLDANEDILQLHKDTPVFDGPYSNDCYQERIRQALADFRQKADLSAQEAITDNWRRLIFHLPYAYQARRMFSEVFLAEAKKRGDVATLRTELAISEPEADQFEDDQDYAKAMSKYLRAITKTNRYRRFVAEKIERSERLSARMGNLYSGSIFLALMSSLEADLADGTALEGAVFGFFAYGSGSKSKVFEAAVQPGWKEVVQQFQTNQKLEQRTVLDYATYEAIHRGRLVDSVAPVQGSFYLADIETTPGVRQGARTYSRWESSKVHAE